MHILPQLRKLEKKYADYIAVIGVHAAKFDTEKATENILAATRRYNVEHPVVNDISLAIMRSFAVRAWPTLMFIDPQGRVIGKHEGEFEFAALDRIIQQMVTEFENDGLLTKQPLPIKIGNGSNHNTTLSFPGKVASNLDNGNLYISDSNHHRVIVTDTDGEVKDIIGNGESPLAVDPFDSTTDGILNPIGYEATFCSPVFDNPQGMALYGNTLYIADAGAHTIISADLKRRVAKTIAGIGEQSLVQHSGGNATALPLNSPYDLAFENNTLYIAMAGAHQIWQMQIEATNISPFAGTGAENIIDGLRMESLLAQPYGLALQGNNLFFADSETSAIRVAKLGRDGRVVTLTGTGLFDFGDYDAIGQNAKLQHPQDVATSPYDAIYIADTYNHKIKRIDLTTLRVTTVAGTGGSGKDDGDALNKATFNEPAGITYLDESLYIADTNNHLIRRFDIADSKVETLQLIGI